MEKCVSVVDEEFKTLIETDIDSLDENYVTLLENNGIILDEKHTEDNALKLMYNTLRYKKCAIDIITTYECNLSCPGCKEKKKITMDRKRADYAAQFIKKITQDSSDTVSVELMGGEPLMNMPANMRIAQTLNAWCEETNRKFELALVTNGTLLTSDNVEAFAPYHCKVFILMDSPPVHDKKRRYKTGEGTFSDVVKGLNRVLDSHLEVVVRIRANKSTKENVVSLLEFLSENSLNDAAVSIEQSKMYMCRWHRKCIPSSEIANVMPEIRSAARALKISLDDPPSSPAEECLALRTSYFTIDPLLRLFRCGNISNEKYAVGKLDKNGYPRFNSLNIDFLSRDPLLFHQCRTCELLPVCPGGCGVQALYNEGTTHKMLCRKSDLFHVLKDSVCSSAGKHSL